MYKFISYVRAYYSENRIKVKEKKWSDILNYLHKNNINYNFDTSNININNKGSALMMLNKLKKSKKYCEFFNKNMKIILEASNIKSLHGLTWYSLIK